MLSRLARCRNRGADRGSSQRGGLMGAVHFSIDGRLLARLSELLPLEVFVETGTYEGASINTALAYFDELHTIEASNELFARAAARFEDSPAVHVHHGSSAEVLSRLSGRLRRSSVLYWLDAHFCGHGSAGGELQCPLLSELEAIGSLGVRSVILIDDARLFMAPPPPPLIAEHWPSFSEVLARLSKLNPGHELIVIDDVIVFFPPQLGEGLRRFAREHAIDWLLALAWARELDEIVERIAMRLERLGEVADRVATSDGQRETRQLIETLTEAVAEARTRADSLRRAARGSGAGIAAVHDEVADHGAHAQPS
jgi:hypothetical protein